MDYEKIQSDLRAEIKNKVSNKMHVYEDKQFTFDNGTAIACIIVVTGIFVKFLDILRKIPIIGIIAVIVYLLVILAIYSYRKSLNEKWLEGIFHQMITKEKIKTHTDDMKIKKYEELIDKLFDDNEPDTKDELWDEYKKLRNDLMQLDYKLRNDF